MISGIRSHFGLNLLVLPRPLGRRYASMAAGPGWHWHWQYAKGEGRCLPTNVSPPGCAGRLLLGPLDAALCEDFLRYEEVGLVLNNHVCTNTKG